MKTNMNIDQIEMQSVSANELELVEGGGIGAFFRDLGHWAGEAFGIYGEACAEAGCTPMS